MDNLFPLCKNCIYADNPIEQNPCNECYKAFLAWSIKPNFKNKPRTNADRIRAMTDEELAEWLVEAAGWLPMYEGRAHPILKWLKQEVEE